MAKGFGKDLPKPKPPPKKQKRAMGVAPAQTPSTATESEKKAAKDFESLTSGGAPEYTVLIRTVPEGEKPSPWREVGGIAVPRSSSEDQALALAIFNNEDDLLRGAVRHVPSSPRSLTPVCPRVAHQKSLAA